MAGEEILVADDDRQSVLLLQHFLGRDGYNVRVATDGRQAMDFLDLGVETGVLPDLVILDVHLRFADGFQVLRHIREAIGPKLRVLMLSQQSREEDVIRALDSGAMDFVGKPYSIDILRARVRNLLRCERCE
ncbi:MAG: hypothetical protein AMXMBFR64_15630 [Myxococcales bacterium]